MDLHVVPAGLLVALGLALLSARVHGQGVGGVSSMVITAYCGTAKGCIREPRDCVSPNCKAIGTWRNSSMPGYIDFELMAVTPGWVALGLSYDRAMGNDSVMHCVVNNASDPTAKLSFNFAAPPKLYNTVPTTGITQSLTNVTASYIDGQLHCRFSRQISKDGDYVFALNAKYYLFLGYGPAENGAVRQHEVTPFTSSSMVDVTTSKDDFNVNPANSPGGAAGGETNTFTDDYGSKATYKKTADGNSVQFTISRNLTEESGWVALGFSEDTRMQDDSVIDCIRKADGTFTVQSSWNLYHDNSPVFPADAGLKDAQATYSNGKLECSVKRPLSGVGNERVYDLDKKLYLMLGFGKVDASGKKLPHDIKPKITNAQVDLQANNVISGGSNSGRCDVCLKRAHGILMITAWVLIVSTSIIIARYFKTAWPGKKICGKDIWFHIHRALMLLALACTIAGFIIIFCVNWGKLSTYPEGSPTYFWVHAPLGICVMILVIINPLMAAFRCKPDARFRPIFNWLHWLVGTCVHVIALITIFFGAKIGELSQGENRICHIAVFWILIAFVGFHVLIEILLSIDKCISEARSKQSFQVQYEMSKPGEVPKVLEPTATNCSLIFRYIILAFYFIVVLGLWMAMVILIGSGNIGYN